ncbi:MAG: hypothetical protein GWP10_12050 [Nitrospiraceae bacterium]|nr:hypothetical protein [Nitrospiraceae bacterium]
MIRPPNRNLERMRASFILDEILSWHKEEWKSFAVQLVKGLPAELRSQGIMATLAKLWHRDEEYTKKVANLLGEWVIDHAPGTPWQNKMSVKMPAERLFLLCQEADRKDYMWAQEEALALAESLKILADAFYCKAEKHGIPERMSPPYDREALNTDELLSRFVLKRVLGWGEGTVASEAATKAKALPVDINSSGILITLANLIRSKNKAQRELAWIIAEWIAKISPIRLLEIESEQRRLFETVLKGCIKCDKATYQAIQAQALKIAILIKAYATALYGKPQ